MVVLKCPLRLLQEACVERWLYRHLSAGGPKHSLHSQPGRQQGEEAGQRCGDVIGFWGQLSLFHVVVM